MQKIHLRDNWLWGGMFLLTLGGLAISAYLMWGYTVPGATLSCGGSTGCEAVKNSSYANLAGIPLPVIGLAAYLFVLGLLVAQRTISTEQAHWLPYVALAIFSMCLIGVLYSGYLTYLELYVIYAICRWCVASAIIMVLLLVLAGVNLGQLNQVD